MIKISFVGPESSGKTTLAETLSKKTLEVNNLFEKNSFQNPDGSTARIVAF